MLCNACSGSFNFSQDFRQEAQKSLGLVSLGVTGRDDISMQFAFRDFRPCWIYAWVAALGKESPNLQFMLEPEPVKWHGCTGSRHI